MQFNFEGLIKQQRARRTAQSVLCTQYTLFQQRGHDCLPAKNLCFSETNGLLLFQAGVGWVVTNHCFATTTPLPGKVTNSWFKKSNIFQQADGHGLFLEQCIKQGKLLAWWIVTLAALTVATKKLTYFYPTPPPWLTNSTHTYRIPSRLHQAAGKPKYNLEPFIGQKDNPVRFAAWWKQEKQC